MTPTEASAFLLGMLGGSLLTLLLRVPLPRPQRAGWRATSFIRIDPDRIADIVERKLHEKDVAAK